MGILSRDAILAAPPATLDVAVPQWGGDVRVKAMSIADRLALLDEYKANLQAVADYDADQKLPKKQQKGLAPVEQFDETILQLIHTIVDEAGVRVFSALDHDQFKALDYSAIQQLFRAFLELNRTAQDTKKN